MAGGDIPCSIEDLMMALLEAADRDEMLLASKLEVALNDVGVECDFSPCD